MHEEDNKIYPSFFLGMVQTVNIDTHTVDILPYGMIEHLSSVPIMTDPANISLPQSGDIAIVIFDNGMRPMAIGFYTKYIRDGSAPDKGQYYALQEGDIMLNSPSPVGGRLMMLMARGLMRFVSADGQGIEVDPTSGTFVLHAHSEKDVLGGVVERSGLVRRKNIVNIYDELSVIDVDNLELILQKIGGTSTPGTIVHDTPGMTSLNDMYEKKLEIKVPGSQTAVNPNGINLIEETIGTGVVANDPSGLVYTETLSSQSTLPLRKKSVYYDPTGVTPLLTEEIDCQGNMRLSINSLASFGIDVEALVPTLLNLLNLTVNATGNISLNGTLINFNPNNGPVQGIVLETLLSTIFNAHTHISASPGNPTAPPLPIITPGSVSSSTVKASP